MPPPVLGWQREAHEGWEYDLEVDTSFLSPEQCADAIHRRLETGPEPTAFAVLA